MKQNTFYVTEIQRSKFAQLYLCGYFLWFKSNICSSQRILCAVCYILFNEIWQNKCCSYWSAWLAAVYNDTREQINVSWQRKLRVLKEQNEWQNDYLDK